MVSREVAQGIFWVGVLDFDRRIFDELIPLPEGTSYNAYLIRGGEKTALIDTVDPSKEFELISNIVKLGVDRIDYVVINHAEQDHSGTLPRIPGDWICFHCFPHESSDQFDRIFV